MTSDDWWGDDERLLGVLGSALRVARAVPERFVEAGKAAYAWRNIDAELAALTYDSRHAAVQDALTRAEPASLRAMTFAASGMTIELHVSDEVLVGQLVPEQSGQVDLHQVDGPTRSAEADELGCFAFRPLPAGSFRLRCHTDSGRDVLTGWISL
jgi:hypothetical protein